MPALSCCYAFLLKLQSQTLVNHKPDFKCSIPGEKHGLERNVSAERFADILALH
jgi:hypothetical protein